MPREVTREEFLAELNGANADKLIVVDFFATWCGPCNMISPFYQQLSVRYPHVSFLKCNVDTASDLAHQYNVSAMPTFVFFKNRQEVDRIRGADKNELENKVKLHSGAAAFSTGSASAKSESGEANAQPQASSGGHVSLLIM